MKFLTAFLIFASSIGAASAQDDVMEVQRCIWRCLADSKGADDPAYGRCVERRCSEKPTKSKKRSRQSDAPAAPGRWTYGEHPRLGLSAYVEVGGEAIGVACPAARAEPHGYAAATRLTSGLSQSAEGPNAFAYVWTAPFALGGHLLFSEAAGAFETETPYCQSDLVRFRTHGAMLLLRERFVSLSFEDGRNRMVVDGRDGQVAIEATRDIARLDRPIEIPLAGAAQAIAGLTRSCPALRRQMAEGCEVD